MAPATGDETRRLLRRNAKRMYARSGDALAESWEVAERRAKRLAKRANLRV